MIHNIADQAQLTAIGFIIRKLMLGCKRSNMNIEYEVRKLLRELESEELDSIHSTFFSECGRWLEVPREFEVLAVVNRMRRISFRR